MITLEDVIKEVSKSLNLDRDTVSAICKHPFQELVTIMKSEEDKDILFNQLFKFKLKKRYKENKQRQYSK